MRYLKYFEGFTEECLNDLVINNNTFVQKSNRPYNNKSNKLSDELLKYDISVFEYEFSHNNYIIYPDNKFIDLYKRYCIENNLKYNYNLIFNIEVLVEYPLGGYNYIDVYNLIPNELKGLSLGYKLYKYILDKIDFIMTNKDISSDAKNLWFNLLKDNSVYSGTNNVYNVIIKKDITNDKLESILHRLRKFSLIYDTELNNKIKELKWN